MDFGSEIAAPAGDAAGHLDFVDQMPALVWNAGPDRMRSGFNQAWLDFTGRSDAQESGLGWSEGLHPDDVQRCLHEYAAGCANARPFRLEYRLRCADGTYRWLLDTARPVFEGAVLAGYLGCCVDISEYKRTEQHLRKLSEVVEQSPSSIMITDLDGIIEYVNPGFTRLTGYSAEETLGRTPGIVNSGTHTPEFYAELWATILSGSYWRGEIQNRKKNGEAYWEKVSISPIRNQNNEITHFLAVKVDITDRKHTEGRLRVREQELAELYAALQTVREEERRAVARELHDELGQMMTALRIDLDWLMARQQQAEPRVHDKLAGMSALIDQTVDTVRRISEDMRPGMLDDLGLTAALENHVAKFEQQAGMACDFVASHEDFGLDDKASIALFRIVQEALTNAARHSGATRIAISLAEKDDEVLLSVIDNGRGLPVASPGRKTFGLLGMRERVAILGGRIEIRSEPSHGVRIEVAVPRKREPA